MEDYSCENCDIEFTMISEEMFIANASLRTKVRFCPFCGCEEISGGPEIEDDEDDV
tara:strand:- start:8186 stop:8353 length:168 start_codon:yes stop_codon:yes gene_type:complete